MDNRKDFYERAFLAALTGLCADPSLSVSDTVEAAKQIAQAAVDAMFKSEESGNDR
jgi:hypothetical protein